MVKSIVMKENYFTGDIDMSANSDLQKANGDGYLLASGSRDRTIRLWNADQGKQIKRLRLPANKRDRYEDQSRARVWLSLCWPSTGQMNLVSSSLGYVDKIYICMQ